MIEQLLLDVANRDAAWSATVRGIAAATGGNPSRREVLQHPAWYGTTAALHFALALPWGLGAQSELLREVATALTGRRFPGNTPALALALDRAAAALAPDDAAPDTGAFPAAATALEAAGHVALADALRGGAAAPCLIEAAAALCDPDRALEALLGGHEAAAGGE